MHIQDEIIHLFFLQLEDLRSETNKNQTYSCIGIMGRTLFSVPPSVEVFIILNFINLIRNIIFTEIYLYSTFPIN